MFNVVYIYSVPNCKYLTVRNEYLTLSLPSGAWEKKKKKIGFSFILEGASSVPASLSQIMLTLTVCLVGQILGGVENI